jgi:hypothetical protein
MSPSIIVFIPYFGKWPEWIDLFFHSVKRNETIDFLIYTDCETKKFDFPNVRFRKIDLPTYIAEVNDKLNIGFNPPNAYKVCDLRPLFGHIHEKEFAGYDFYGWCDVDLIFGNIRKFYSDEVLKKYDVLSTHSDRISGHFALFRNNRKNRHVYQSIYKWREALDEPRFKGIDENGISRAYTETIFDKINDKFKLKISNNLTRWLKKQRLRKLYFKEQYTTPFIPKPWLDGSLNSDQPVTWFYEHGNLYNTRDGERSFIYLHFMNFKSSQWRHDGTKAPWEGMEKIYFLDDDNLNDYITISEKGIYPTQYGRE